MRLILADQTIIEGGSAGYSNQCLWLFFTGMTLQEAATIFFDTAKTSAIVFQYGDTMTEYAGYTNCINLFIDGDGEINVCMVQGVTK